jgi:hypothetical protein
MSSETQRLGGPPTRRAAEHTYFVGRRLFEAAEIYGVIATVKLASDPEDFSQENSSWSSRRGRLRPPFRRTAQRSTNA